MLRERGIPIRRILLRCIGAFVALGFSTATNAASIGVVLTDATLGFTQGPGSASSLSGTLAGNYDTTTGVVTMDLGTTTLSYGSSVYDHILSNWSTGGGSLTADSFSCAEGTVGPSISLSFCGDYNYGPNSTDDSFADYSGIPGIVTLGGDDTSPAGNAGVVQATWYRTDIASLIGATLTMESSDWDPNADGVQLIFAATVPVPAAFCLFASALGLLGWMRRKTA
jgi:hypothetical protein